MASATVTPEVVEAPAPTAPVKLTDAAIGKVKEIMSTQDPIPAGLRIGVVGGGCSGFQYSMSFENQSGMKVQGVPLELPPAALGGADRTRTLLAPRIADHMAVFGKLYADKGLHYDVAVDATSAMYLNGCVVDYVETLEAAGFKFENPTVKSTCGCGSSFSV